ncbi:MAG: hypothetical protein AB1744_10625, partial [Candidatus Zixiibacteriota bacterium]
TMPAEENITCCFLWTYKRFWLYLPWLKEGSRSDDELPANRLNSRRIGYPLSNTPAGAATRQGEKGLIKGCVNSGKQRRASTFAPSAVLAWQLS